MRKRDGATRPRPASHTGTSIDQIEMQGNNGTLDNPIFYSLQVARARRQLKQAEDQYEKWEEQNEARHARDVEALMALKKKRAAARELREAQRAERRMDRAPSPPPLTDSEDAEVLEDEDKFWTPAGQSDPPDSNVVA